MFEVEYFTVDAPTSANRYVTLTGEPDASGNVALDIIGGTAQMFGSTADSSGDFMVDTSTVRWDNTSSPLYTLVGMGDKLRVIYDRS